MRRAPKSFTQVLQRSTSGRLSGRDAGYTGQRRVIPLAAIAAAQMMVDWLGVAKNRAPYRERLVWGVAPFAVRTDDMRGTLYALPVRARAVRQRKAVLQAAIGRTVRATAQTARRFPFPAGKARERRHSHLQEILPKGLRLHSNLASRSRPGLGCEQTEARRPRRLRQSVEC